MATEVERILMAELVCRVRPQLRHIRIRKRWDVHHRFQHLAYGYKVICKPDHCGAPLELGTIYLDERGVHVRQSYTTVIWTYAWDDQQLLERLVRRVLLMVNDIGRHLRPAPESHSPL
jgi:hypothetical protein